MLDKHDLELISAIVKEAIAQAMAPVIKRLDAIEKRLDVIEKRLDAIEKRLDVLEQRVDALEKRMDALEKRMDVLEQRVGALEKRMDVLEDRVDSLENQMNSLKGQMDTLEEKVRHFRLIVENDVQRSINIIAEGHQDLNRKLEDAIIAKNEREMILLRISVLERDVRGLKQAAV